MQKHLVKKGYIKENIINDGNSFLLANGHLGYRGTLEEYDKAQLVSLNLVGVYDQYQDKWRESINLPNPFFIKCFVDGKEISVLKEKPLSHFLSLDLTKGYLSRHTEFSQIIINSKRFVSHKNDSLLSEKYDVTAKEDVQLSIIFGLDTDIYEINGPHFQKENIKRNKNVILFNGMTNEGKDLYLSYFHNVKGYEEYQKSLYKKDIHLNKGEKFSFVIFAIVEEERKDDIRKITASGFNHLLKEHCDAFFEKYSQAHIEIKGDKKADLAMRFSLYQLLSAGDANRCRGIPARGCSGQTYKGAIFWDSEMFLIPFYALTNPIVARNSLIYRINTLSGAMAKAKEFGYQGAFYAWESQDSGLEACSKYNVTDPKTGAPIRTYFNEKQIHISADIVYAFDKYIEVTGDSEILNEGGLEVIYQCALFFLSYAKKVDGKWHIYDVIGPDEYHERINDNAFTNYLTKYAVQTVIKYLKDKKVNPQSLHVDDINKLEDFANNLCLLNIKDSVIEQFDGYFALEDVSLSDLRKRIKDPKEYWGGEYGVASHTKIIKQADVCALIALFDKEFNSDIKEANFAYYYPKTEHGSSLSSGMYSRLAFRLSHVKEGYEMFKKSAEIDIVGSQKIYAGGIYIGGTHIASSGGAYLSLLYGCLGFSYNGEQIYLDPHLPKTFKEITMNIKFRKKKYVITVHKNGSYTIKERQDD